MPCDAPKQDSRDQKPADHEEHVHADEPAGGQAHRVLQDDEGHGNGAQSLDVRPMATGGLRDGKGRCADRPPGPGTRRRSRAPSRCGEVVVVVRRVEAQAVVGSADLGVVASG